jgi:siroheme synthase
MRSDPLAKPRLSLAEIVFVGCDPRVPAALSWPARAALDAADAVLYDRDVADATLALLPPRCFAEPVAGGEAAVARAARLARDGWRVARLLAADPATAAAALAEQDRLSRVGIDSHTLSGTTSAGNVHASQPLATALNGLAG